MTFLLLSYQQKVLTRILYVLCVVGKAFAVATVIIFGGGTLLFGMAVSKLDLHNVSIIYNITWIENVLDAMMSCMKL